MYVITATRSAMEKKHERTMKEKYIQMNNLWSQRGRVKVIQVRLELFFPRGSGWEHETLFILLASMTDRNECAIICDQI